MDSINYEKIANDISQWLRDYLQKSAMKCFVVGVSGGIDSALVSTLCARSGVKTYVLNLPLHSKPENTRLSDLHCRWLTQSFANVENLNLDISSVYDAFIGVVEGADLAHGLAAANTKSRLRMVTLYYIAQKNDGIVVGTGNKIEDFGVGFFTKYGDGGVDVSPIADLTKTQVRSIAQVVGVSTEILEAPPTDGLWEDSRTDEQQIGASYEELEWAMAADEQGLPAANQRQKEVLEIYRTYQRRNLHKMQAIPVYKLNSAK